jgi:hypothetical protein
LECLAPPDLGGEPADNDEGNSVPAQHAEKFDQLKPTGYRHTSL